jgi:hypothetical protein
VCAAGVGRRPRASPARAAWTPPRELPDSAARYPLFATIGSSGATTIGMYGPLSPFGEPQAPVAVRAATPTTFGMPQLVLAGADVSGTAAGAIGPGGRAIVVGGPQQVLNRSDPPALRVTQLLP